jgi:hypothetical protein
MSLPATYLELLETRIIPNRQQDVIIQFGENNRRIVVKENDAEITQNELSSQLLNMNILDKRKQSSINRQFVLDKLRKQERFIVKNQTDLFRIEQELPMEELSATILTTSIPVKVNKEIILTDKTIVPRPALVPAIEEPTIIVSDKETEDNNDDIEKDISNIQQLFELNEQEVLEDEQKLKKVEELIKEKPKRGRKPKAKQSDLVDNAEPVDLTTAVIRTQKVIDRLPKEREKNIIVAPPYYLNNRKLFIQKMSALFEPRRKELLTNVETISCARKQTDQFDLLTHQKIVRDYLNLYTPYRGLLLYHGLGSGKTCTSIAIAEGMKSDKQVFVMTPASLKMNFFSEMKKCGDELYKKNQYWEFVTIDGNPEYVGILSRALAISPQTIRSNGGAWLVNVNKPANFTELTSDQQASVDAQLNEMIRAKYKDINYNGLNMKILNQLTKDMTVNPFDNSVIIIDEAHNFVSRIVNKIKSPKSISYILYDYLMKANNARIVLLSGTPIINYPNEIGILYNILRGYIKTWSMTVNVTTANKVDTNTILSIFDKADIRTHDFVQYSGNKLIITRNPYGFINLKKRGVLKGTQRVDKKPIVVKTTRKVTSGKVTSGKTTGGSNDAFDRYDGVKLDDSGNLTDADFIRRITSALNKSGLEVSDGSIEVKLNKSLPDDSATFLNAFVDSERGEAQNINLFQRRILGLTSYFRSAQENLLPKYVPTENGDIYHVVKNEMTPYQFGVYAKIRKVEADREKDAKKQQRKKQGAADELFTMSSTYRIFSRAACNFVFPEEIERPVPNIAEDKLDEKILDIVPDNLVNEVDIYANADDEQENSITDADKNTYAKRIENALNQINVIDDETTRSKYLTGTTLRNLSPKFYSILENISNKDNRGLHLLYSHFRTIEGIGLMKLILLANGFAEFKIQKSGDMWDIVDDEQDKGKPTFVLYTGTETAEEKEIIRNVYNGDWGIVPINITNKLKERAENNVYGEIIKVFMITSSGAEGINLKNTRFVHVVEPYWHMVRVEQVVGRARRICSHQELPEELRTVQVYLYITTFSKEQQKDEKNIELRIRDVSRIDRVTPVTTDETLYEIASIKQRINNQILQAVKETAIDCSLYSRTSSSKEKPMVCYGYGKIESNAFGSYPTFEMDREQKVGLDMVSIDWDVQDVTIQDVKYVLRKDTMGLYSFDSYNRALENPGLEPEYIGLLVNENGRYKIVPN